MCSKCFSSIVFSWMFFCKHLRMQPRFRRECYVCNVHVQVSNKCHFICWARQCTAWRRVHAYTHTQTYRKQQQQQQHTIECNLNACWRQLRFSSNNNISSRFQKIKKRIRSAPRNNICFIPLLYLNLIRWLEQYGPLIANENPFYIIKIVITMLLYSCNEMK